MNSISSQSHSHHVVLFPFMAKGHTIPILYFARLLLRRPSISVTVFTTPANRHFISEFLADTTASIIDLPFPQNIPEIPPGIETTHKLPSMSLFPSFALATQLIQKDFERALQILPRVSFLVSDVFLWWTLESANKFNIPRFVFYGTCKYSVCVERSVTWNGLLVGPGSDDELITVPGFPWIKVTRRDFDEPKGSEVDLMKAVVSSVANSYGFILNSFYELEHVFVDYWNSHYGPKAWCVGPFCLADPQRVNRPEEPQEKTTWKQWLDHKIDQGGSVLYIAFGTHAEISIEQIKEIAIGLEKSGVNFLWVIRNIEAELGQGFEERVKERGIVVRDWVDQREILEHESVQGFLSHCGWNSVLESVCAGVPILAWPVMAEQPLTARMVVEEMKVGLRVETCDGSVRGFVKWEGLKKMVKELMEGEMGKEVRNNVKVIADMAKKAMEENNGSSWCTLDLLLDETSQSQRVY
ncbi:hypothetical protein HS088_TW11G00425 [Tripterygium wilfordii]|uniref:Glycosyltransferase n=1 Tax=Tripterygium wilfordii TaxID=458696 RepID=A0A7J7D1Y0_TRIWF|nr:UDP-glycosyltransferase 90A1-like [Tripterygium wilfordii]KAF5740357.1 hypothetical protein HS088_TW11G00425 [Tripterygium wilfordii]